MRLFYLAAPLVIAAAVVVIYLSSQKYLSMAPSERPELAGCNLPAVNVTGQFLETKETAIFNNRPVSFQMAQLTPTAEALAGREGAVLGATTEQRWIEIDLSEQKLYAHNGDKIDYEFLISSGKWAPTPIGEFRIWTKLRYTKMEGGKKGTGTYYYLPNVPYTQYFYKGFGIHGTYWHNNFGTPMSHGCVNISILDAEKLFYWSAPVLEDGKGVVYSSKDNPGTKVVIHD